MNLANKDYKKRVMKGLNGSWELLYFRMGKWDLSYWDWDLQFLKQ